MPHGNRKADDAARTRATQALDVLRRWGIRTLGQYAALPAAELSSRLGPLGPRWQRAAYGQDMSPLVPLVDDEPFEASLALEWPVEGLEPLSFVLARVLEPLAARLERADRGAAVLHTELHLTSRERHVRTLQLPAPMRDPKTLRTLILLDLESHPPSAAIDRVVVRVNPTPGRIVQWSLLERAQPSTEQVSTLLARLSALMGESHVGSPQLVDSWRPGAFAMRAFSAAWLGGQRLAATGGGGSARQRTLGGRLASPLQGPSVAFRRFRLPVPARVTLHDGRPVRLTPDRRGVSGGAVVDCAGPWRTSGHWWDEPTTDAATAHRALPRPGTATSGTSCSPTASPVRVFLEREVVADGSSDGPRLSSATVTASVTYAC